MWKERERERKRGRERWRMARRENKNIFCPSKHMIFHLSLIADGDWWLLCAEYYSIYIPPLPSCPSIVCSWSYGMQHMRTELCVWRMSVDVFPLLKLIDLWSINFVGCWLLCGCWQYFYVWLNLLREQIVTKNENQIALHPMTPKINCVNFPQNVSLGSLNILTCIRLEYTLHMGSGTHMHDAKCKHTNWLIPLQRRNACERKFNNTNGYRHGVETVIFVSLFADRTIQQTCN